jgi:protein-S-isoprenylcysteine O-methyltransferase Ste14
MFPFFKATPAVTWLLLFLYWIWSSRNTKIVSQRESAFKRFFMYLLPLLVATLLLGPGEWFGHCVIRDQFVPHSNGVGIIGAVLCIGGMVLACRARYLLGRNWSLSVQLKEAHELIVKGPYRYVRHPIYTGLLCMFLGNAFIVGDWRGLIAVLIVLISFWRKLKLEENWLGAHFGERYDRYKETTKAILPWVL